MSAQALLVEVSSMRIAMKKKLIKKNETLVIRATVPYANDYSDLIRWLDLKK